MIFRQILQEDILPFVRSSQSTSDNRRTTIMRRAMALVVLLLVIAGQSRMASAGSDGRSTVRWNPKTETMEIEASNARVADVLADVSRIAGIRTIGKASSRIERVSGTIKGSVGRVLDRLLNGRNFVFSTQSGTMRLLLLQNASPPADGATKGLQTSKVAHPQKRRSELLAISERYRAISTRMAAKNPDYAKRMMQQAISLQRRADIFVPVTCREKFEPNPFGVRPSREGRTHEAETVQGKADHRGSARARSGREDC